ncbi:MAG TPA: hypothetical protein VGS11_10700 [Candidatus Bathyarchaeia archaeon]|nr:hypothetical protein [Candidatus Bathyarchaeia archaeon]
MEARDYVVIAAFSALWVVLAYLSGFTTVVSGFISFFLPVLLIFTVPLWFGKRGFAIGLIGGVLGKNFLVSGGPQNAVGDLIFTVGVMMGGMYLLAPSGLADMKRARDWVINIVLNEVLLFAVAGILFVNLLLGTFPPNYGLLWTIVWTTVLSSLLLAVINCVLLRTLTPVFKRTGLYSGKMAKMEKPAASPSAPMATQTAS